MKRQKPFFHNHGMHSDVQDLRFINPLLAVEALADEHAPHSQQPSKRATNFMAWVEGLEERNQVKPWLSFDYDTMPEDIHRAYHMATTRSLHRPVTEGPAFISIRQLDSMPGAYNSTIHYHEHGREAGLDLTPVAAEIESAQPIISAFAQSGMIVGDAKGPQLVKVQAVNIFAGGRQHMLIAGWNEISRTWDTNHDDDALLNEIANQDEPDVIELLTAAYDPRIIRQDELGDLFEVSADLLLDVSRSHIPAGPMQLPPVTWKL